MRISKRLRSGPWNLLHGALLAVIAIGGFAELSAAASGTALWRSATTGSTNLYSRWDGAAFGPVLDAWDLGAINIVVGAEAPARNEIIVVGVYSNGQVKGQMWEGVDWTPLPFNVLASISDPSLWGCDVDYERDSSDAMIVWNNRSRGDNGVSYRVWNGAAWSTEGNVTTPLAGEPQHMHLAADPGSDEMVLVISQEDSDDFALVWDGNAWGGSQILETGGANEAHTDIDVAYEQQNGRAMAVYGRGDTHVHYRLWDGGDWSDEAMVSAPAPASGVVRWVRLAADPNGNRIALAVVTDAWNIWVSVWDGATWEPGLLVGQSASGLSYPNVAVTFEGLSGEALVTYSNSFPTIAYRTWTPTEGWSQDTAGTNTGSTPAAMTLQAAPGTDQIMLAAQNLAGQLFFIPWDGNAWGQPQLLEWSTGAPSHQPFMFVWDVGSTDLAVTKNVDIPTPGEGDAVTYTVTLANQGPLDATGITLSDQLPAGLTYQSHGAGLGTYDPTTGIWDVGWLASGATATLTLVATVDLGTAGTTITNTASILSSDQDESSLANNTDAATIVVTSEGLRIATGWYDGDGSTNHAITGVGFAPNLVIVCGESVQPTVVKSSSMPGSAAKLLGQTDGLVGGRIQSLDPDGFTVGLFPETNGASVRYHWVAFQTDPSAMAVGSYPGDGAADRLVPVGFEPGYVVVMSSDGDQAMQRYSGEATGNSLPFSAAAEQPNRIESFEASGFKVGSDGTVNRVGTDYHFVAWKATQGLFADGLYTGDSNPARDVAVGFKPRYVLVTQMEDGAAAVQHPDSLSGDLTLYVDDSGPPFAGGIRTLLEGGFGVGDHASVNGSGNNYFWTAFNSPADLSISKSVDEPAPDPGSSITFTVAVTNHGPDHASGVAVADPLPAGLAFQSAVTDAGYYDEVSGRWEVGGLDLGATATLAITVLVDAGAAGQLIVNTASLAATDQWDPAAANNLSTTTITVGTDADLEVQKTVDRVRVSEGETVVFTVVAINNGPSDATGVEITDALPAGLTFDAATTTQGTYEDASGRWTVGSIGAAASDTLTISAIVDTSTAGSNLVNTASVTALDQPDPEPGNDSSSALVSIDTVDLAVNKSVDDSTPHEGDTVIFTIVVTNVSSDAATGVEITDPLPAGLNLQGTSVTRGTYTPTTGRWVIGTQPGGVRDTLRINAGVDGGTAGSSITNTATLTAVDQTDTNAGNDTSSITLDVQSSSLAEIRVSATAQVGVSVLPGDDPIEVLRISILNNTDSDHTLAALTVHNEATGPGTQVNLDASWAPLTLGLDGGGPALGTASFSSGAATFGGLALSIPAGQLKTIRVLGGAALAARDGDLLDLRILGPTDFQFAPATDASGSFPIDPPGSFVVDGMAAAQIALTPVNEPSALTDSDANLILDVLLPPNGYEDDVLQRLNVVNQGTALPATDITRMDAWLDDGSDTFDPQVDTHLGQLNHTGDRWELTGMAEPVSIGGLRLYITSDIGATAVEGRTIQAALPAAPEDGIGMLSANDGPRDHEVANPVARTITNTDRVSVSAIPVASTEVHPGDRGVVLLEVVATNRYAQAQTLQGLELTNLTSGTGSSLELDAVVRQLSLRLDGDDDGVLGDLTADPLLGTSFFEDGRATFTGLNTTLLVNASRRFFVTAEIALNAARDGDQIGAAITGPEAIGFGDNVALAGSWPIDSGARYTVDGMVTPQIVVFPVPVTTLGPGDGPALAMDVLVPRNGYADDALRGIAFTNVGSASAADVALDLWADGGDGVFDAGGGDDQPLGSMTESAGEWSSLILTVPLDESGTRIFAAASAAAALGDSTTVQLSLPLGGITVDSTNDGPVDRSILQPNPILLSNSDLLIAIALDPSVSTLGQPVTAAMTVRNAGDELINDIAPTALSFSGSGSLSLQSGPSPAAFDLAPGAEDTFAWTLTASSPGDVRVEANASGVESGSGQPSRSLVATSNAHRVFVDARDVGLFPVESMPFSVNRGQSNVVPLSLTFTHEGGADESDIAITTLRFRLEEENQSGVVPAELLSRVTVNEGTTIYLDKTMMENDGAEVSLPLATPILVEAGNQMQSQVTVNLSFTVWDSTAVPNFRVVIAEPSWITANELISSRPVSVNLRDGTYPIRSGLARVAASATGLDVDTDAAPARDATRGQTTVELLELELLNPDPTGLASDVRITSFAVTLVDSSGTALADPAALVERLRVHTALQPFAETAVAGAPDSMLILELAPLLSAPANTPISVFIDGDIVATAPFEAFRLRLGPAELFDAREANTGAPIEVTYGSAPIEGPLVRVHERADQLDAAGSPLLPPALTIGSRDVGALAIELAHPGSSEFSDIRVDALILQLGDQVGAPLVPATYLDRVRVVTGSTEVGVLESLPGSGRSMTIPLADIRIPPGGSTRLDLLLDFEATAPPTYFQVTVPGSSVEAVDANVESPVGVSTADGLPLTSGLTELRQPPVLLAVGFADSMPAVLASDGSAYTAAVLELRNPATAGTGAMEVDHLIVRTADRELNEITAGGVLRRVDAYLGETLWASSGELAPDVSSVLLTPATSITLAASEAAPLRIEVVPRGSTTATSLRLGIDETGIGVVQPANALLTIAVRAVEGLSFPLWTEAGTFTAVELAASYSNFPNPFAAGRQETRFSFYLEHDSRVTLEVRTLRSEPVRTLLEQEPFAAGLHQSVSWDGRNGRGDTVLNGIYIAELRVQANDGSSRRLLRKVAVLR